MNRPPLMDSSCPVSHFVLVQQQWMMGGTSPWQSPPSNSDVDGAAELPIGRTSSAADARHRSTEAHPFGTAPSSSHESQRSERALLLSSSDAAAADGSAATATSPSSALWDAVPGAVGGFCSVLVGHPLDLLKVRMQAGGMAASTLSAAAASPSSSSVQHYPISRQMTTTAAAANRPWSRHPSSQAAFQTSRPLLSLPTQGAARMGHLGVGNTGGASPAIHWGNAGRSGMVGTVSAPGGAVARAPVVAMPSVTPTGATIREMAMDVVRQHGIRGLYAGMTAPLLAVVPAFGVTIWSFESAKRELLVLRPDEYRQQNQPGMDPASLPSHHQQLTVTEAALAGAASGIFAAFVLGPLEKIKCEFQLHPHRYRSFWDCLRIQLAGNHRFPHRGGGPASFSSPPPPPRLTMWSLSNPYASQPAPVSFSTAVRVRELFRGTFLTICRDVPGNAMYFAVYESVRRTILAASDESWRPDSSDASSSSRRRLAATALAGGIAGVANWCLCLPVDAVKTRWQTSPAGTYSSPLQVLRDMLREGSQVQGRRTGGGVAALYRGLGPAVLRAFPANAVALCAVDVTRQVLGMPTL